MTKMMFKFFTMIFCDLLIYCGLTGNELRFFRIIVNIIFSFAFSSLVYFVPNIERFSFALIIITTTVLCKIIYKELFGTTFIYLTISYVISYFLHAISMIITIPCYILPYVFDISFYSAEVVSYTVSFILQLFMIIMVFRVKRFKKGMPFIRDEKFCKFGVISSIIISVCSSLVSAFRDNGYIVSGGVIICICTGIIVFMWWQNRLTMIYTQKRFAHDIDTLNAQIEQQSNEIALLTEDNERLSSIVHKDNKLIPAMLLTVDSVAVSGGGDAAETAKLMEDLNRLADERKGVLKLAGEQIVSFTSESRTNAILQYFYHKAKKQKIEFEVRLCDSYAAGLPCSIAYAEICTIIADLVENAFIAVVDMPDAKVKLTIDLDVGAEGIARGLILSVYDNGPAFDKKVLNNIGVKRITTRKETGGSGIGLMTASEFVKNHNGRIDINEDGDGTYTKRVSIIVSE